MQKQRDDGDLWQLLLQRSPGSFANPLPPFGCASSANALSRARFSALDRAERIDGVGRRRLLASQAVKLGSPFRSAVSVCMCVAVAVDTGLSTVCLHLRVGLIGLLSSHC
jgi:hypothetical protein